MRGSNQWGKKNNQYKHGMCGTPEYKSWDGMRYRCNNPNSKDYFKYGALGVTVCKRWDSFINFYADMGPKPSPSHTIDRKDPYGNYTPENCRWATKTEQSNNQRKSKKYKVNGNLYTIGELATKYKINYYTLWSRLNTHNWPIEKAIAA